MTNSSQDRPQLQWFRWWIGAVADPKLTTVARRSKQKRAVVVAVWAALLEAAASANSGGRFDAPFDEIAAVLEVKPEQVSAIVAALEDRGLLAKGVIANWDKRQYASDSSTARVRKHRNAAKERSTPEGETLQERSSNGDGTLPEQRGTPSDQRRTEENKGDAPTGAGTPSGSEKKERVREKITAPPPADEEDAGWDRNGFRNDCAIYAQEAPWLQEAVGAAQKGFRGQTLTRWAGTLHYLLLQNPKITGAKVVEWLQADPPDDSTNPKWWWGARKREEAKVDRADPTPEDPAEASARIYRETPWAFKTPEAIAVQVGQWEQLLFDTFGKPENAEVERQYHAAWREYQATGDAEAFPLPPEGLGVPT